MRTTPRFQIFKRQERINDWTQAQFATGASKYCRKVQNPRVLHVPLGLVPSWPRAVQKLSPIRPFRPIPPLALSSSPPSPRRYLSLQTGRLFAFVRFGGAILSNFALVVHYIVIIHSLLIPYSSSGRVSVQRVNKQPAASLLQTPGTSNKLLQGRLPLPIPSVNLKHHGLVLPMVN
ncbi:MAG: hypothetical protein Q9174_001181 [Haloplaca sp. 1 TL-2023]